MCCGSSWLCLQLAEKVNGHSDPWKESLSCSTGTASGSEQLQVHGVSSVQSVCRFLGPQGPCQPVSDTAEPELQHLGE